MKKKSSPPKSKKNPFKLVKNSEVQVLSLIEKLEKSTEKRLSGFVQELVKLKKKQVKLQEKLTKANKLKEKKQEKEKNRKAKSIVNLSSKKSKKTSKKKKPNPFTLVDNNPD